MEIRSLDFLLAVLGPDGQVPVFLRQGRENPVQLLTDGALRLRQGEYLWPLALQGRPLPEGEAPLPPAYTSVHLSDSGVAAMRSDWGPRAHYMVIDAAGHYTVHAYGQELASGTGPAREAGERPLWTSGLFLDALGARSTVLFVKPVGDLPGYWLITDFAPPPPERPGLQVIQAPLGAVLLAPYDRFPAQLGAIRIDGWAAASQGAARCWRVVHAQGYDLLAVGDGESHTFADVELTTDARFTLIRVRGHQAVARQISRGTVLRFREEELV